jgi:hypothetical protein
VGSIGGVRKWNAIRANRNFVVAAQKRKTSCHLTGMEFIFLVHPRRSVITTPTVTVVALFYMTRITETITKLYCKELPLYYQNLTRNQQTAATKHSKINTINTVQICYHLMNVAGKLSTCH